MTAREYAQLTLTPGSELNAIGVYAWFHVSAMQKATRLAAEQLAPAERAALARAMMADEAFALHFLEDTYAAGHAQRQRRLAVARERRRARTGVEGRSVERERQPRLDGDIHLRRQT